MCTKLGYVNAVGCQCNYTSASDSEKISEFNHFPSNIVTQ